MMEFPLKTVAEFNLKDLHKKIGRLLVIEPNDSDINEGNFSSYLYFQTETEIYLLDEWVEND